jgi:protein-S-isoprenylcysteine O-methyltransferase Ste14
MPSPARHAAQTSSIAEAMADVIGSARHLITEQVKVARLETRTDIAHVLRTAALGAVALVAAAVAVVMGAIAAMRALSSWIPTHASMAVIATVCGASAVWLFLRAHRSLPSHFSAPKALSAPTEVSDDHDHGT